MTETWTSRDLPVLQAIVQIDNEQDHGLIKVDQIEDRTGFDQSTVQRALKALAGEHPPFFTKTEGSLQLPYIFVAGVTGHARRTVGAWPSPENMVDRLVEQMRLAAEESEDEETSNRLRRTAAWFGGVGRDLMVEIIAAAITRGVGLG